MASKDPRLHVAVARWQRTPLVVKASSATHGAGIAVFNKAPLLTLTDPVGAIYPLDPLEAVSVNVEVVTQVPAILGTSALAVPEPSATEHVWPDGCAITVIA